MSAKRYRERLCLLVDTPTAHPRELRLVFIGILQPLKAEYIMPSCSSVVADSKYLAEAYKLINFINSHVWPKNQDGADGRVYGSSYLIQPRFYITDEYDITATIVADYSLSIEIAPLELADFITAAIPELLESLAPYIFGVVVGSLRLEDAIQGIKHNVLFEEA